MAPSLEFDSYIFNIRHMAEFQIRIPRSDGFCLVLECDTNVEAAKQAAGFIFEARNHLGLAGDEGMSSVAADLPGPVLRELSKLWRAPIDVLLEMRRKTRSLDDLLYAYPELTLDDPGLLRIVYDIRPYVPPRDGGGAFSGYWLGMKLAGDVAHELIRLGALDDAEIVADALTVIASRVPVEQLGSVASAVPGSTVMHSALFHAFSRGSMSGDDPRTVRVLCRLYTTARGGVPMDEGERSALNRLAMCLADRPSRMKGLAECRSDSDEEAEAERDGAFEDAERAWRVPVLAALKEELPCLGLTDRDLPDPWSRRLVHDSGFGAPCHRYSAR